MIFQSRHFLLNSCNSNKIQNISYLFMKWPQGISYFLGDLSYFCLSLSVSNPHSQLSSGKLGKPSTAILWTFSRAAAMTPWQLTQPIQLEEFSTLKDQYKVPNCISTKACKLRPGSFSDKFFLRHTHCCLSWVAVHQPPKIECTFLDHSSVKERRLMQYLHAWNLYCRAIQEWEASGLTGKAGEDRPRI